MRIGIYNPTVGSRISGGTETFIREIIKRLQKRHDIILFTGKSSKFKLLDEFHQMNIEIIQIPFIERNAKIISSLYRVSNKLKLNLGPIAFEIESISMYTKAINKLREFLKREKVDVLSTHYYIDNLLISRLCRKLHIPTIFRFPGIKCKSIRWVLMAKYATPTLYLANSINTAKRAEMWLGIKIDGIVYPGVDIATFNPNVDPIIKNENDEFKVLFVGRLEPGKGVDILLKAIKELIKRKYKIKAYLIGDGVLGNDIKQEIRALNIDQHVVMLGAIPNKDIPRYLVSCDIFCLPTIHEGFSVAVIEAMACGKAVVCTRLDSTLEQITDGKDGLLFNKGDYKDLANKIEYLYNNEDVRKRLGKHARKKVIKKFTWDKSAKRMEVFYEMATES